MQSQDSLTKIPTYLLSRMEQKWKCMLHEKFKEILSEMEYKNLSVKQFDLFLNETYLFIRAYPDRILKYDCHKNSRWKCPYSICNETPNNSDASLLYLKKSEDEFLRLGSNHHCYKQYQQQMGVSGNSKCFFVLIIDTFLGSSFRPGLLQGFSLKDQYFLAISFQLFVYFLCILISQAYNWCFLSALSSFN